jgi:hypothetical protein
VLRLAFAQGEELAPHGCTAVALTPGWMRSEMMLENYGVTEESWRDGAAVNPHFAAISETPRFVGRAVAALAADPDLARRNGGSFSSGGLAREYGFTDLDGSRPDCWRYMVEVQDADPRAATVEADPDPAGARSLTAAGPWTSAQDPPSAHPPRDARGVEVLGQRQRVAARDPPQVAQLAQAHGTGGQGPLRVGPGAAGGLGVEPRPARGHRAARLAQSREQEGDPGPRQPQPLGERGRRRGAQAALGERGGEVLQGGIAGRDRRRGGGVRVRRRRG